MESPLTLAARRHHAPDQGLLRARGRNRTDDLLFTRQVLCRLSYSGGAASVPTAPARAGPGCGCLIDRVPGRTMVRMPPTDLTPMEQSILDFERSWWQSPGPKGDAIRTRLQISPSAYYRRLDALIDDPDALDLDPLLVRRLRRARADRRRRL